MTIEDVAREEAKKLYSKYKEHILRIDCKIGRDSRDGSYIFLYWLKLNETSLIPGNHKSWFWRTESKTVEISGYSTSAYIAPYLISPTMDESELIDTINRHSSTWKSKYLLEKEHITLSLS